jgi:hypothetical protein
MVVCIHRIFLNVSRYLRLHSTFDTPPRTVMKGFSSKSGHLCMLPSECVVSSTLDLAFLKHPDFCCARSLPDWCGDIPASVSD